MTTKTYDRSNDLPDLTVQDRSADLPDLKKKDGKLSATFGAEVGIGTASTPQFPFPLESHFGVSALPITTKPVSDKERYTNIANADANTLISQYDQTISDQRDDIINYPFDFGKRKIEFEQSREGKAGKMLKDFQDGKANSDDLDYLRKVAPKATKEVMKAVLPDVPEENLFAGEVLDAAVRESHRINVKKQKESKVNNNQSVDAYITNQLSNFPDIQINLANITDNEYSKQLDKEIKASEEEELSALESRFPQRRAEYDNNRGVTAYMMVRDNEAEYKKELTELRRKYDGLRNMIGMKAVYEEAKLNPSQDPLTLGEEWAKIARPDEYKLWVESNKRSSGLSRDMAQVGVNGLYNTGNTSAVELAYADETLLDDRFPEQKKAEVLHRLGAELSKTSNWFINRAANVEQLDEAAKQLTKEDRDFYYKHIREEEKRNIGTNVPMRGAANKFGEGAGQMLQGLTNYLQREGTIGNIAVLGGRGSRTEQDVAADALNAQYDTQYQDVGDYAPAVQRLKQFNDAINAGKQLTKEEIKEKEDLETYTGVRSGINKVVDGSFNLAGQVAIQALLTRGLGGIASKGIQGLGLLRTGDAAIGLTGLDALAANATNIGIVTVPTIEKIVGGAIAYASSYDQAEQDAFRLMPDEKDSVKRGVFTNTVGLLNAVTENIFRDSKVLDAFNREISPSVRTLVNKLTAGEISKEALAPALTKILKQSATFVEHATVENAKESFEEFATSAGQSVATAILAPTKFNLNQAFSDAIGTFTSMFADGGIIAVMAGASSARANNIGVRTIASLGVNKQLTADAISYIDAQLANGTLTLDESNEKKQIINTAIQINTKAMPEVAKMGVLSDRAYAKYSVQLLNEKILADKIEKGVDPVLQKQYEKQIKESQSIREKLLDNEVFVDTDFSIKTTEQLAAKAVFDNKWKENITAIDQRTDIDEAEKDRLKTEEDARHAQEISDLTTGKKIDANERFKPKVSEQDQVALNEKEVAAVDALNKKDFSDAGLFMKTTTDVLKDENATPNQKREALKSISDQLLAKGTEVTTGDQLGKEADVIYNLGYEAPQEGEALTSVTNKPEVKEGAAENVVPSALKEGDKVQWDLYGNEDKSEWTVKEHTTTKGGEKAVVLTRKETRYEEDKNGNKYEVGKKTVEHVVPLSEFNKQQTIPTEAKPNVVPSTLKDVESTAKVLKDEAEWDISHLQNEEMQSESLKTAIQRIKEGKETRSAGQPVQVRIFDNGQIAIEDGNHRVAQALANGETKIKVSVRESSQAAKKYHAAKLEGKEGGIVKSIESLFPKQQTTPTEAKPNVVPSTLKDELPNYGKTVDTKMGKVDLVVEPNNESENKNSIKVTAYDDAGGTIGFSSAIIDPNKKTLTIKVSQIKDKYQRNGIYSKIVDEYDIIAKERGLRVVREMEGETQNAKDFWANREQQTTPTEQEREATRKKTLSLEPPPDKKGRTPVTLSGNTEKERQTLINQRKADTYVPSKVIDEQKLLERVNKYNNQSLRYKRSTQGRSELNNIRLSVDSYNKTYNQKYTVVNNRAGNIEYKNSSGDKVKTNNKTTGDLSIDESGVPLMQRGEKTKNVFADLLDLNLFPTGYTVNGERMTEAQLDGTIQDIMDGIPSRAANNYLDALEKMIEKDDFDFSKPDIPQQERITLNDIHQTEKVQEGEPMTEEGVMQMLEDQSKLTPDQEQTVVDNIENLINEYEQHDSNTGQVQTSPEEGQATSSTETKQDTQPEGAPSEAEATAQDKFNEKVDRVADALIDFLTPKVNIEGVKKSGIGIPEIVRAGADVIKAAYKIKQDIGEAIGKGIEHMKQAWQDAGFTNFPEDGLKTVMDKEFADLKPKQAQKQSQSSGGQQTKTDNEKISEVLSKGINEVEFPTILSNNQTKEQLAAKTQGDKQNRQVDGPYVVALETDLREISIQSAEVLRGALGADWGEKTLKWIEDHPSQGNIAQVVGILNIISTDNYQDIQATHNGNQIRKLTNLQKRIDKVSIKRARDASLGLVQRKLYEKFAQGGNMNQVLAQSILSPEMNDLRTSLDEILSEDVSDEEINKVTAVKTAKPKKQSLVKQVMGKTKKQSDPALKNDLILQAAAAANKTGKTVKELIAEANEKIKNIKC